VRFEASEHAVRRLELHDREALPVHLSALQREDVTVDAVHEERRRSGEPRLAQPQREVGSVSDLGRQRRIADLEGEVPGVSPEVVELVEARVADGAGEVQGQGQVVAEMAEDAERCREVREVPLR
jgi:hypothetical protein